MNTSQYYYLDSQNRAIGWTDELVDVNGQFWTINTVDSGKIELAMLNRPTTRLIMPVEHLIEYTISGHRSGSLIPKGA